MRSRLSSNEETYYEYSFGKTFTNPTAECWYFEYKKRYSIIKDFKKRLVVILGKKRLLRAVMIVFV
jgi:hypothetical protein